MAKEVDRTIEVAALGRPFSLGMLYDCRRDLLIPGESFHRCSASELEQSSAQSERTERTATVPVFSMAWRLLPGPLILGIVNL
ncbi:uncharacterized protein V6R79_013857 [Siganus canaliculatus]